MKGRNELIMNHESLIEALDEYFNASDLGSVIGVAMRTDGTILVAFEMEADKEDA